VPRPRNIITAYAVVGASRVFDWVEGDLCALFGMGVGAGERRLYRRMRATRARRRVVWQVLGDMIRLGWERQESCNDRDKQAHRKEAGSRLVRFS